LRYWLSRLDDRQKHLVTIVVQQVLSLAALSCRLLGAQVS
jgi:hypothetical protein